MSLNAGMIGGAAGRHGGLERRQIDFVQAALGYVDRGVVEPGGRRAIGAEMLGRRRRGSRALEGRRPGSRAPWPRRSATPPRGLRRVLRRSAPSADRARRRSSARRSWRRRRSPPRPPPRARCAAKARDRTPRPRRAESGKWSGGRARRRSQAARERRAGFPPPPSFESARAGSAPQRLSMQPIRPARMPASVSLGKHRAGHHAVGGRHSELADFFLERHCRQKRVEAAHRLPFPLCRDSCASYHRGVYPPTSRALDDRRCASADAGEAFGTSGGEETDRARWRINPAKPLRLSLTAEAGRREGCGPNWR